MWAEPSGLGMGTTGTQPEYVQEPSKPQLPPVILAGAVNWRAHWDCRPDSFGAVPSHPGSQVEKKLDKRRPKYPKPLCLVWVEPKLTVLHPGPYSL